MSSSGQATKRERPPNPACGKCRHAMTFHPRDHVKHRRACKAFGCDCKNFAQPSSDD